MLSTLFIMNLYVFSETSRTQQMTEKDSGGKINRVLFAHNYI